MDKAGKPDSEYREGSRIDIKHWLFGLFVCYILVKFGSAFSFYKRFYVSDDQLTEDWLTLVVPVSRVHALNDI